MTERELRPPTVYAERVEGADFPAIFRAIAADPAFARVIAEIASDYEADTRWSDERQLTSTIHEAVARVLSRAPTDAWKEIAS